MKKQVILGAAILSLSLLAGCGGSASKLPDYSEYVTLGNYTGLGYTPESLEVTDDEVEAELDSFVNGLTEQKEVTDRASKEGDSINIDYVGSVDGVEFEGGSTQGQGTNVTVGQSGYIDNFDEQLVGMKIGETKDIIVTFPEEYPNNPDLANKEAVFKTTLNSITESVVPELTDDLVKKNTEYETIDAYKEHIKEDLKAGKEQEAEESKHQQLLDAAAKNATYNKYPQDEIKDLVDQTLEQIKSTASQYGIEYTQYINLFYQCQTEEEFEKFLAESAKEYVQTKMAICTIAKKENIKVSGKEIDDRIQELIAQYDQLSTKEDVLKYFKEEDLEFELLQDKVAEFLAKSAVEQEATTEAADSTAAE